MTVLRLLVKSQLCMEMGMNTKTQASLVFIFTLTVSWIISLLVSSDILASIHIRRQSHGLTSRRPLVLTALSQQSQMVCSGRCPREIP